MNPKCGHCGGSPLNIKMEMIEPTVPAGQPIPILGVFCCSICGAVFNVNVMGMKPPAISLGGTIPPPNTILP